MAVTQVTYTGNGSTTNYSFTFPYLDKSDVKVKVNGTTQNTTEYSFANATTVAFNTAPANNSTIIVYRDTDNDTKKGTFYAGSAIKAEDLNDNFDQILYVAQEVDNNAMSTLGTSSMQGDMTFGKGVGIVFEGDTDDAYEVTVKGGDPTADRTITLPDNTGTIITTASTNVVDSDHYVDGSIDSAHISNDSIDSQHYAAGSIDLEHMSADSVDSAQYVDGSIDLAHMSANSVDSNQYVDGSIDREHLAADIIDGTKIADNVIDSEHYVNGSIDSVHIANYAVGISQLANDSVNGDKLTDNAVDSEHYVDGSIDTIHLANDAVSLDKLADNSVQSAQIINGAVIEAKINTGAVTNAKIGADAVDASKIADNAVTTDHIADAELTTLAGMQSGTASVLASSTTLTATIDEINIICDGKTVQTTITDSDTNYPTSGAVVDYVSAQITPLGGFEAIANEDSFPADNPAAGVIISIADATGITVDNSGVSETARQTGSGSDDVKITGFPASLTGGSGTNANPFPLPDNTGLLVVATGTQASGKDVYTFHRLLPTTDDVKQLSDDVNDFFARYRINAGEPSSNNDDGDLVWDTNANKMKVYDGTASAWKEVTSVGDFKFLIPVDAGTTTAATWDGSDTSFDLKESTNTGSAASINSVYQLMISVNGVIQKPNTGTYSASEEGFYLTDSDTIRFCTAPPTGSSVFIIQLGAAVSLNAPADDSVSTVKLQNLAVTTGKIAADAVDGTKIADDSINSEHYVDASIDAQHIAANAVGGAAITTGAITTAKIAADQITGALIADDAVGAEHIEVLDGDLKLADGQYLDFGDGGLKIRTNSNNAYIQEATSGKLAIQGSNIEIANANAGATYIYCTDGGAVTLYHNNNPKIETTDTGVKISDSVLEIADTSCHIDLMETSATNHRIRNGSGNFYVQKLSDDKNTTTTQFVIDGGTGEVALHYDGSGDPKLQTRSDGVALRGTLHYVEGSLRPWAATGSDLGTDDDRWRDIYVYNDIDIKDYGEIRIGNSDDLKIYHDASDNIIHNNVSGKHLRITNHDDSDSAVFYNGSSVNLYYAGNKKLETTDDGAKVTGYVFAHSNISDSYYTTQNKHVLHSDLSGGVALAVEHSHDSNPYGIVVYFSDDSPDDNTQYFLNCTDSTESKLKIYSDGDVVNHDNAYGSISDVKLKENIVDAGSQWNDVKAVKVRNFNFKSNTPSDKRLGVVAQELETVSPGLVTTSPDLDINNNDLGTTTKSVKYSILYMKAFKALQEAITKIETLETKVAALEAK